MAELRRDPIGGHWVILAPGRQARPHDFQTQVTEASDAGPCPFCPGNESHTTSEIRAARREGPDGSSGWSVRVIHNMYPALTDQPSFADKTAAPGSLYERIPAQGFHELVITSPDHDDTTGTMTVDQLDQALSITQQRMHDLIDDERVKSVLLLENHGPLAGASRAHPHWQLLGFPLVPRALMSEICNAQAHHQTYERCLFCDVVKHEEREGSRLVSRGPTSVVLAPFASRVPFELLLLPRAHRASFLEVPDVERRQLASDLRGTLRGLREHLGDVPFNWFLHTTQTEPHDTQSFHWHIEILPRLGLQAGIEWGGGVHVNSVPPEEAAARLRGER